MRDIGSAKPHSGDILAIQTRYQSISVTADGELIYTAAQGKEHALSSMWHFISSEKYGNASELRVELTRYTQGYAPQETQTLRGISLLTRAIKTHLCAVNGGTE